MTTSTMPSRATQGRRDAEWERATTPSQAQRLLHQWAAEDAQAERAASVEGQRLDQMERRLVALERMLGPGGKHLTEPLIEAIGEAIPKIADERIDREFERRQPMTYRGVWSPEASYKAGDVATCGGGAWTSKIESRGSRPGTDGAWRLIAKGSGS